MSEMAGLGTKLQKKTGATYADVAQVAVIGEPPSAEAEVIEVPELDPASGFKKKITGILDAGDVGFTLNFDPANTDHMAFLAEARSLSKALSDYRILFPGGEHAVEFQATVGGFSLTGIASNEVIQAEVSLVLYDGFDIVEVVS